MFRGNRTPDDLTYIDSTDNDTVRAVKSAWNLNRYGTSWPEILKAVEQAEKDAFIHDSLRYVTEQAGYDFEPIDNAYERGGYTVIPIRSEDAREYKGSERGWYWSDEGRVPEEEYFKYLDSIYVNPVPPYNGNEFPLNKEAEAYQYWKAMKYGK